MLLANRYQFLYGSAHAAVLHIDKIAHGPNVQITGNVLRHSIEQLLLPENNQHYNERFFCNIQDLLSLLGSKAAAGNEVAHVFELLTTATCSGQKLLPGIELRIEVGHMEEWERVHLLN